MTMHTTVDVHHSCGHVVTHVLPVTDEGAVELVRLTGEWCATCDYVPGPCEARMLYLLEHAQEVLRALELGASFGQPLYFIH